MNKNRNLFLKLMLIHLVVGMIILFVIEKGDIVLFFSDNRRNFFNYFFKYITHLGDGLVLIPLVLLSFFIRYYWSALTALSSIFILLFSQGFKRILFSDFNRPSGYFDAGQLNFIEGVKVHEHFSFPSGHTITAFAIFFILALMINRGYATVFMFLLALLVGISRVYILQHFYIDIYFGSLLGVLSVVCADAILKKYLKEDVYERLMSKSLLQNGK